MNLSTVFCSIQNALTTSGWQSVIEDDDPNFKQLSCNSLKGPLGIFTHLDVLVMTPGRNSAEAAGICICFLFYADPTKVVDMFRLGRLISQDESHLLRSQCDSIFNATKINPGNPSIKISVRPKQQKIIFNEETIAPPAFMVELGYWLSREELTSEGIETGEAVHFNDRHAEQIIDDRIEAIYSFQGSDLKDTEDLLFNAVDDPNPQIRIAGLAVLSGYCDGNYLKLFEEALKDDDEAVRRFAGEYLKAYRKHIRRGPIINTRQSIDECLKNLTSSNDVIRRKAVDDLTGVTDPRIIQPLLAIMKGCNDDHWCRSAAMDVLDTFECPEMLDEFYSLLGDEQIGVRAAYKLVRRSDPLFSGLLHKAFFSDDRVAKLSAAHCVVCNDDSIFQGFCQMLGNIDFEYRKVALSWIHKWALQFNEKQENSFCTFDISEESIRLVVSALKATSTDEDGEIRGKAIQCLCLIDKPQGMPVLMEALEGFIRIALNENYKREKENPWDFDWFQVCLNDAIVICGDKSFCEPLRRLCNTKDWTVKFDAINTLLKLGDASSMSILVKALGSTDWMIRVEAAKILIQFGDNHAWNVLARALTDDVFDDFWVKAGIVDALANSGDARTFDLFTDILNDVDTYSVYNEIIGNIIIWLGDSRDPRAIAPIAKWQYKELINCDDDIVEKALQSLNGNKQN